MADAMISPAGMYALADALKFPVEKAPDGKITCSGDRTVDLGLLRIKVDMVLISVVGGADWSASIVQSIGNLALLITYQRSTPKGDKLYLLDLAKLPSMVNALEKAAPKSEREARKVVELGIVKVYERDSAYLPWKEAKNGIAHMDVV